jgi:transcriptional regulator of acetoin/glycerol metabolism
VDEVEKNFLLQALAANDGNITRASKATGLQRTNFQNLLKKHGIKSRRAPHGDPPSAENSAK